MTHATSAPERTRRLDALRAAMDEHGYDVLLVAGRGDEFMRGRLQYVSDVFEWSGWGYVVLPRTGDGVLLADPLGGYSVADPAWLADARVSADPVAEIAALVHDLGAASGTLGVAGLADIVSAAHADGLRRALPQATLADATDVFDDVRAVKSQEELANLEQTSEILATVFTALEAELRPGAREVDVLAEAHRLCRQLGCVEGIAMMGRAPAPGFGHGTPDPLVRSDVICVDLEWGGPTGYWLELRRNYSFGPPPDRVRRLWEARVETFEACMEAIRPGASSQDILAARDRVYARHGLTAGPHDVRYSSHGIGVDSLEPPWVPGKERVLRPGMMLSLHPNAVLDAETLQACGPVSVGDNVLVTETGARRMTYAREEWVTLEP